MKFGLPISFGLHASFLVIGALVLSAPITPLAETKIIPITIVNVGETTNVRPTRRAPKPAPIPKTPQTIVQPEPIKPEPEPVPEVSAEIEPKEPKEIVKEASLETSAQVEPESFPTEPVKPEPTPEPNPVPNPESGIEPAQPEPQKPLSLTEILALADKAKSNSESSSEQRMLTAERNQIETAAQNQARIGNGDALSTSYEDAIMRKVYRGWQIPAGAPNMESLVVTVELVLGRNGRIETSALTPDSEKRMRGDRFYTAAAESALRAVNEAAHFNFLPQEQYEKWQYVTLTFYPQDAPSIVPI